MLHCGQIPSNRLGSPNRLLVIVIDLVVSLDPSCRAQEPFMFLFLAPARFDTIKFYCFFCFPYGWQEPTEMQGEKDEAAEVCKVLEGGD